MPTAIQKLVVSHKSLYYSYHSFTRGIRICLINILFPLFLWAVFTVSAVESFVFLQEHVSLTIGSYQILILSPVIVQCFQVITDLVTQMDAGDFNQVWNKELLKITCLKKSLTTVSTPDHSTVSSFGGCLICDPSDAGQSSSVKKKKNEVWVTLHQNCHSIQLYHLFGSTFYTLLWVLHRRQKHMKGNGSHSQHAV